ncbi:MAG: cyclic-di-AMP receptor [Clostridia bacterium]|jgi:uncharacterized protein YaaQ
MKLVFAIVHNEDGHKVTNNLTKKGFSVTKLCSTGGFLREGNTTLLVGVKEKDVNEVIAIIQKDSKSRKEIINSSIQPNVGGMFMPYPVEVIVGGGTVFVIDVERFEKV